MCTSNEALPGVLGIGEMGICFRGTSEQRPNFERNEGTKTILGHREHKKTDFRFFFRGGGEGQGNKPIYFRGTREQVPPLPPGRAS